MSKLGEGECAMVDIFSCPGEFGVFGPGYCLSILVLSSLRQPISAPCIILEQVLGEIDQ